MVGAPTIILLWVFLADDIRTEKVGLVFQVLIHPCRHSNRQQETLSLPK